MKILETLLKEAEFTKEVLGSGVTQIRKASFIKKGLYFQSFTNLATGLERIGKLCILLDCYIDSNGKFPDYSEIKNGIGHDLEKIYKKSMEIKAKRSYEFRYLQSLDSDVLVKILKILSDFSKGDRYSNLNLLTNGKNQSDPIQRWVKEVDETIYKLKVKSKKKLKIEEYANYQEELKKNNTKVLFSSEDGNEITSIKEAFLLKGRQSAVAPYRLLYVVQIVRFWYELLCSLQMTAMEMGKNDIPYFDEVFRCFHNDDSYIKRIKKWEDV